MVKGKPQVVFGGGDGWVYGFEPKTGKLIWKFDANPKDAVYRLGGSGTKNDIIATPVVYDDKVFIGVGQDPEHGEGVGNFWVIDATLTGDITDKAVVWRAGGTSSIAPSPPWPSTKASCTPPTFRVSSTPSTQKTGALYWKHDMLAAVWASPLVADGKIYLGDEDGDVAVLAVGKTKKLLSEMNMGSAVYATPVSQGRRPLHPRPESPLRDQGRGQSRALEGAVRSAPQFMTRPLTRREWLWAGGLGLAALGRPRLAQAAQAALLDRAGLADLSRRPRPHAGWAHRASRRTPKLLWSFEAESEPDLARDPGRPGACSSPPGTAIWWPSTFQPASGSGASKVEAGFEGAPSCADGLVLIPDLGGAIHAYAPADGKKVWSRQTEGEAEIKASVAVASGVALVGAYDGTLHALNLSDGARRWSHDSAAQIHATCAIQDGVAYVAGCDGHFRGLDVLTGKEKFDVPFGGYTAASPAMADGIAVFGTFGNDVVGIDLARKSVIWRYAPKKQFPFYSSALVAGGLAIVGSRDKSLHVLDQRTGPLQWTFETQGKIDSSPVLAGPVIFFGSHDGRIRGLDVKTRKSVFSYETGAPIATSPAIAESRLLVAASDGRILCFG